MAVITAVRRTPDVILLDLKLSKLSGHDVLRRIKDDERLCTIPVIVLTTSSHEADHRKEAYRHHANSYLVKPADVTTFQKMIRDLKCYWASWNERPAPAAPA